MSPVVEIRDVAFAYGRRAALSGISLAIQPGERVAVLGPNGSGKSTLIKILSRTLEPAAGEVRVLGRPLPSFARCELSRKVAVVPQETQASFPYTAAEIVLMGRASYLPAFGLDGARDREIARDSMRLTGTLELADRYLHELSSGEKQRVILARALAQEAEILLLDEPTSFLDIRHQIEIHELLVRLNRQKGLTIVAALHDFNLASLYFPRLVLLESGRISSQGAPAEVLTAERIRAVYGARVRVLGELGERPQVLPLPKGPEQAD
ncbi:MAG TPA: ABC transporter ATP-binding protein [Candidatus Acidoferrales bacterium]|nr:ABC transporter ATP-binding protein [Candidatus Acidoferrales bacterium]